MSQLTRNFQTRVGAASLVAGPLLMAVGDLIHPQEKMNAAEQVAVIAGHASRWYAAHLLLLVGMLLFVPGVLLLTALAEERKPVAGYLARLLLLVGIGAFSAVILFEMLLGRFIADGSVRETASDVLDTFQSGAVFGILAPALLAFFVGVGWLVFALGSSPGPLRWPVLVLGLGAAFILAEIVSSTVLLSQIGNVTVLVATSWVAWLVVRDRSESRSVRIEA